MSARQRHSTGSLNNEGLLSTVIKPPKKGILKRRPHTFHQTRPTSTGLIPLLLKTKEKKSKITCEEEKKEEKIENKDETCLNKKMHENEVQQFIQKIPQRVEFAEMNAVFGDTTDTVGLNNSKDNVNKTNKQEEEQKEEETSKQKRERKKERKKQAIVSPLIRQKQIKETTFPPQLEQPTTSTEEAVRLDEENKGIDPFVVSQIIRKWWCPDENRSHEIFREQKEESQSQENEAIKKELRRAQLVCKEKERHLTQLRDRLAEIETIVSSGRSAQLAHCAQLSQRLSEREEEFTTEIDGLVASHEHRVRQLVQEIVDLRAELVRKEKKILTFKQISRQDQTTQTDNIIITEETTFNSEFVGQKEVEAKIENKIELSRSPTTDSVKSIIQTKNIQTPNKASVVQIGVEVVATLEAYRNEAAVWITRCANLELIMQDLLLREGARRASENGVAAIGSALFINVEGDNKQFEEIEEENENKDDNNKIMKSSSNILMKQRSSPVECQISGCIEKKKKMMEQNNKLTENINKLTEELNEFYKNKKEEENKLKQIELNSEKMIKEHEELAELAEKRGNDAKAVKLTLQQVQSERDNLKQAIAYLERRCYALEQLGLENGILLVNEPTIPEGILKSLTREELEFNVRKSKDTQTALTVDDLGINERTMDELQIRIRVMQSTFAEDKANMREQLEDIERILLLKTELTNTLANQLDEAAKRTMFEDERNQNEIDLFRRRIEELGRIAERVPILESEIEKALTEKSKCELRLRDVQERLDDNMEKSLENALKRDKAQERYWSERIDAVNRKSSEISAQLEHERHRAADERLKWALERADLERRLTSAIEHAEQLFSKLNCPRRDVQCEVRPRTSNKYIFCRPIQKDQQVDNSDLRDEQLEQLVDERVAALAAELIEKQQQRRKTINQLTTTPSTTGISSPDFLTISFQRKGGLVEFGGSIPLGKLQGNNLQNPFASTNSISIASLPTNLGGYQFSNSEDNKAFMAKSCEQLIERDKEDESEEEENISKLKVPRHLSLPHNRLAGSTKSILRSHSAPRRQEVDRSRQILFDEQIEQQSDDQTKHFGVANKLRERVKLLLYEKSGGYKEELFDQLDSWLQALAENEKYCYELKNQNLALKRTNCELRGKLKDAELELWIYRTEPRREAAEIQNSFLIKKGKWQQQKRISCSAEQLVGYNCPPMLRNQQLRRWKEVAGTCFREVNNLRKRLNKVENDRLSQIGQLSILRGELAMAKCQAIHSTAVAKFAEERRGNNYCDDKNDNEKWKSVPELAQTDGFLKEEISLGTLRIKKRREAIDERERSIVSEALRRQFTTMKEDRNKRLNEQEKIKEELKIEQNKVLDVTEKLKQINAECGLLRRENSMYEQKCVEMDRDRQQMYLVMFRKGQQAANQKLEEEMDEKTELQVVLHFLHDAFFYYLLSKGSAREHLQAIMTMLNFTAEQKDRIYKQRGKSLQP